MTWLNPCLIASPKFCLCVNERQFKIKLKQLNVNEKVDFVLQGEHTRACCHFLSGPTNCVIVCIKVETETPLYKVYALLVHEAVHIYQDVKRHYTETFPGSEFEAYCIQAISEELIQSYMNKTK